MARLVGFDGTQLVALLHIALAMLLGGVLGAERERQHKPAGLRTHMLVAGSAASSAASTAARDQTRLSMADDSKRAVVAALAGNVGLAVLKGVAAAMTGSAAMFAETLHSIADSGNEVLLFLGMRLARRPPDERHPLGHGRDVYFWAFVVS